MRKEDNIEKQSVHGRISSGEPYHSGNEKSGEPYHSGNEKSGEPYHSGNEKRHGVR